MIRPDYSEEARLRHLQGEVVAKVLVGTTGDVLQTEIMRGVDPLLDEAALAAARKSRFEPGRRRGIPVKARMAIPYTFKLAEADSTGGDS